MFVFLQIFFIIEIYQMFAIYVSLSIHDNISIWKNSFMLFAFNARLTWSCFIFIRRFNIFWCHLNLFQSLLIDAAKFRCHKYVFFRYVVTGIEISWCLVVTMIPNSCNLGFKLHVAISCPNLLTLSINIPTLM